MENKEEPQFPTPRTSALLAEHKSGNTGDWTVAYKQLGHLCFALERELAEEKQEHRATLALNVEQREKIEEQAAVISKASSSWVLVSERRPDYLLGVVLYFPDTRAQAIGVLDVDDRWCVGGNRTASVPSHWMPMREDPK